MITSSPDVLINNVNALRRKQDKPRLTKTQIAMIHEQVVMRERYGRFTLFPEVEEARLEKEAMLRA